MVGAAFPAPVFRAPIAARWLLRGDLCLGQAGRILEPRETQTVTGVAQHTMAAPGRALFPVPPALKAWSLSLPAGPVGLEGFLVQTASGTWFVEVGASEPSLSMIETIL